MSDTRKKSGIEKSSGVSNSRKPDRINCEEASDGILIHEATSREIQQQLFNIIEFLPDATFVIDQEKKIIAWNRACEIMTGVKKKAMLGQGDFAYAEPFFGERRPILVDLLDLPAPDMQTRYRYVKREGNAIYAEFFIPRLRGGQGAHLWGVAAPLFDQNGRRCGAIEVVRDVTEQKRAEESLRQSEEQYRLIMENLSDLVAVLDLDGHRLYNSPSYQSILGDPGRLRGSSSFDEIHPEDKVRVQQVFRETVRTGVGQRLEYRLVDQNGQTRFIESQGNAIRDTQGRILQVVVVSRDVTERKQAEERLEASERKYRELVELANSIILRWTSRGEITFLNEFGQRFFGYSSDEILGRHVIGTIVPSTETSGRDLERLMKQICMDPKSFEQSVNENMCSDLSRVWISWTNRTVMDAHGQVAEILSIGTDITERKRAEEQIHRLHAELRGYAEELEQRVAERTAELAVARDRAEAADRLKSAFLATMSHELRTPLNSIIGFTGIILQGLAGPVNAEQHKQLEMVRDSARHLLALINDVLDISKIEAGQLEVSSEPFNLRVSIEKVVGIVKPLSDKKNLALQAKLAPDIDRLVSDPRRIEQILLNLLNNAIKFTERGSVTLNAEIVPNALPHVHSAIQISIADTGIGIKPEDLSKLFQPFRQIDTGLSRQHEGTGLGLAICRRLGELLGGEIHASSVWGKGSVFMLTLPLKGLETS